MHKGTAFVLVGLAVAGGYAIGKFTRSMDTTGGSSTATVAVENVGSAVGGGPERKRVPLDGPFKGPADALVSIVEFSDFQCPFCTRVVDTLNRLSKEYPNDVRIFFKHYPLPFHQDAPLASQAALAAGDQGKFWEMHDKLFANQQALKRADLDRYAQELGLDMAKFKSALDSGKHKAQVDADMALGAKLGVQGTPNFFINGRPLAGAYPYDEFKKIVDDEIERAKKLVASGTPRNKVYQKLMAGDGTAPAAAPAPTAANDNAKPQPPAVPTEVYQVTVGNSPTKGGKQPKVTIVEFSEFQCPFCSRVGPTLKQVLDTYKDDVQIAFKHLPLPFHDNAQIAAEAAEAAKAQGKFWEMHDKMFENQGSLDRASLERYAQEIGLDVGKFKAFLDAGTGKKQIDEDKTMAGQFGARGTPTFFVNGRLFVGAQPFDNFKALIDEELKKADEKLAAGVPRKSLYAELIKDGRDKAAPPPPPPGAPSADTIYKAEIKGAPLKGAVKDALVTIVQFSDYQCPFCKRVEPTMDRILEDYKGKVRVAWRDFPLDFHQNAVPAAIAARAAGAEGKFWEMHRKLFETQALERSDLERYAQELKLDMKKFTAALDGKKWEAEIKADMAAGQQIGVRGTPAFFINGRFLSGAQPYEAFKPIIDEELKKAEAMVAKGTPKAKVYDEILKGAGKVAAAPAAEGGGKGPEDDQTVVKVDPGKSYARGPKNAPITMVVFSDFQCPFCKRVEPTLDEIEKLYPGKIRKVWKNYPLPFHNQAKPAAIAALAAGEQGKFWEMHAKLFENQTALDDASLEKYAQELKLDLAKFKKSMQDPALASSVDEDMKQASALGVTGTPATFINGRKIGGAYPLDTFKKVVEQELAKAKKRS